MKKIFTPFLVLCLIIIGATQAKAQCILKPGALSFTGVNLNDDGNGGSQQDDAFSFIIMQDLSPGFEVYFTDLGWLFSGGFQLADRALSDGVIKWTVPAGGIEYGQEVTIFAKYGLSATLGTVTGVRQTQISGVYMDLGIIGDQLFAFTGTVENPDLVAGMSIQSGWNQLDADEFTSSNSSLPTAIDQLGIQHTALTTSSSTRIASAVLTDDPLSGDFIAINNLLNLPSSWQIDSSPNPGDTPVGFQLPVNKTFVVSPFAYLNEPSGPSNLVYGETATFEVVLVDTRNIASYQWEFGTDQFNFSPLTDNGNYSGTQNSSLDISNLDVSLGTVYFRVTTVDDCGNEATSPVKELALLPTTLTPQLTGTITKEFDGNTDVTVTGANLSLQGNIVSGDEVGLVVPVAGNFEQAGVGTNLEVTVTGLALTGADQTNYQLSETSVAAAVGEIVDTTPPTVNSIEIPQNGYYATGDLLEFTLVMSENVQVETGSGFPGLRIQIGEEFKEARYVSGDKSASLLFSYTIEKDMLDTEGIDLIGLSLNGGLIFDQVNLDLDLTLPVVSLQGIKVDALAPDGYSIGSSIPDINSTNQSAYQFPMVNLELGATITYQFLLASSPFSNVLDGSELVLGTTQDVGDSGSEINFSAIADGEYTIRAFLTDSLGNVGTAVSRTVQKDATAPSGYSIRFDEPYYNLSNSTGSVSIENAEANSTYQLVITSSGDGNTQTIERGPVSITGSSVTIPLDFSPLDEGELTASLYLVDEAGNQGDAVEATAILDLTPPVSPSVPDMTEASDTGVSNTDNSTADKTPTFTGTAEANATVELFRDEVSLGTTTTDGSGNWSFTSPLLADGTYSITATATDEAGNTSLPSDGLAITIDQNQCNAQADFDFSPSNGCSSPLTVFFTDQSTSPDQWEWDFGDGSSSTAQNPIHSYTSFGEFTVKLTVTDTELGCSTTIEKVISNYELSADFNSVGSFGCGPLEVDFEDLSTGAESWNWDFGDGNTSDEQNPTHRYEKPGVYSVTLTTGGGGCTESITKTNLITVIGPDVDFTQDVTEGCGPLSVSFTNNTSLASPIISYLWEFGDGATSTLPNPTHEYTNAGTYTVKLTASDLDGCSRTLTKTNLIEVKLLKAELIPTHVTCNGGSDGSINVVPSEGVAPFTYEWDHGPSSAMVNGLSAGTYSVKITDANGCTITESIEITEPIPAALTTSNPSSISYSSAVLGGELLNGLDCVQETGIVYSTTPNPDISDSKVVMTLTGNAYSDLVTGLQLNTLYYVKAYNTNQNGVTTYGDEVMFTTSKKTLIVTADADQNKIYGDVDPAFTYGVSGFENGDDESILTGSLSRTSGEGVGIYAINLGSLSAGDNYTIDYTGANFEITERTLSVVASLNQGKVYGE
ncbi:PKD domain-containing protein, partial [Algoriphagus sp.]|uniref:PKD domain-containing protein n=1 Tax=Algoriphagus sp. TaxID=1872435 RepID=UPI00262A1890